MTCSSFQIKTIVAPFQIAIYFEWLFSGGGKCVQNHIQKQYIVMLFIFILMSRNLAINKCQPACNCYGLMCIQIVHFVLTTESKYPIKVRHDAFACQHRAWNVSIGTKMGIYVVYFYNYNILYVFMYWLQRVNNQGKATHNDLISTQWLCASFGPVQKWVVILFAPHLVVQLVNTTEHAMVAFIVCTPISWIIVIGCL